MLKISMLPADHGDCILIEYGAKPPYRSVLIDGGTGSKASFAAISERLARLPKRAKGKTRFELMIVTHIDADHIGGAIRIVGSPEYELGDVWFNGYRHLNRKRLGGKQGDVLSTLLARRPWNCAFDDGGSVVVPDEGRLPSVELDGGLVLTLVSPGWSDLERLEPDWRKEVLKAGLEPGKPVSPEIVARHTKQPLGSRLDVARLDREKFHADPGAPNGSSIAVVAEFGGKRALLTGDAWEPVLRKNLARLAKQRKQKRMFFDVFKIAHHGSRNNTSAPLVRELDCKNYLVSTNGSIFGHPDREAIAHIVAGAKKPKLMFNYRTEFNRGWQSPALAEEHGYSVEYGRDGLFEVAL